MPNLEDLREAAATAARGHNLIVVTPPAPAYAASVLGGLLGGLGEGRQALLLCPAAELDEWGAVASGFTTTGGARVHVAHGAARAMRRLKAGTVDLLITTPDVALALLQRAALKVEALTSLFLAWPEIWAAGADEALAPLMQDLPKECQRLIFTAHPQGVQTFVERYARKALTIGLPAPDASAAVPAGTVRTVTVSWSRRVSALADIVELLDPGSLAIWTLDDSRHGEIARAVPLSGADVQVVAGDAPKADVILAFDLPTSERLVQLLEAGEVVLLVPPSADGYVERLAAQRRPLRLPSLLDTVTTAAGARRAAIVVALEARPMERALLTLAPLFERYDPAAVAAALFELWTEERHNVPTTMPDIPATARVYLGIGKKDGITVNDVVAALTKDLRVERTKIGKIELRDAFALVELPAQEAEAIARALSGTTIRRKRVSARIDRGGERARPAAGRPPRPRTPR